jgi:hypothetical protein
MMLCWRHKKSQCMWEFRDDERVILRIADEWVWEARQEPGRSGLQNWIRSKGIDQLPDEAFDRFEA